MGAPRSATPSLMPRGATLGLGATWLLQSLSVSLAAPPQLSRRCEHEGFGYDDPDHPDLNGGYVTNRDICQQTCRATFYCEVFTFLEDTKACWLHGSRAVARPMSHAFSAERWCDLSKVSTNSEDFQSILAIAQKAALKAEKEGLGLGEQLFAATAATKEAMAGDLKGAQPEILPLVSGQVAAEYAMRLGRGVKYAVLAAASATSHAAADEGLNVEDQHRLAAKSAAIAASSATQELHLPLTRCAQEAAAAAQKALAKLGLNVEKQAIAAVSAASSYMVASMRRKGKTPVEQAVAAAAAAKAAAAGAGQNETRQVCIALDVAIAVASDGMRQQGHSSSVQAETASDAAREVAKLVGLSLEQQQQEADVAYKQVKDLVGETGKRADVAFQPWQALSSMPHQEFTPAGSAQLLGAAPASKWTPDCARAQTAYSDPDHPTLNGGIVDNPEHCQVSCSLSWFCESFTFYVKSKECWLLGIRATPRPDLDAISGPQVCGTEMEAAAKAIADNALDAASRAFASGGLDPNMVLNRAAEAARDTAKASKLPETRKWQEVARAVGAAAAWIEAHEGASVDMQASAAAKAAESVAESHGMSLQMQLQLAVEAAAAAAAKGTTSSEKEQQLAVIKAAKDAASSRGVGLEEQTDLAVEAAARLAGLAAKEVGETRQEQLKAVAEAAEEASAALGLATPRAKEVAATATSSAYVASKDISNLDPVKLAVKTLGFDPATAPKCSIVNTAFKDVNHKEVNGGYVSSAAQCQATCQTVWYCEVFTYDIRTQACHLLGDKATASPAEHVVSGPVHCGQRMLLHFVSIRDAMQSMSNAALQAAQESRLAGKGLTEQLHAAKTTVESFTADAKFSRTDQVQMASVAVASCAAHVAKEAGLDADRQLHAANHAARKAARQAGMTEQEQWQQVATAAAATTLSLTPAPTRDARTRAAQIAALEVSETSPFAPEVQVEQTAKAVEIAMAFAGAETSDLPAVASKTAKASAETLHLNEASQTTLADQAREQALDIQKHFEAMVDKSVMVKKDILPGLGSIARDQSAMFLGSIGPNASSANARITDKVKAASEFGQLHDVISHAIDGTTTAEIEEIKKRKAELLGSSSSSPGGVTGIPAEESQRFMWGSALVVFAVLLFAGLFCWILEAGRTGKKKRHRKSPRKSRSGPTSPSDWDTDMLLYADEAPQEPGPEGLSAPPQMVRQPAPAQPVWGSQGMINPGSGYYQYHMPPQNIPNNAQPPLYG